MSALEVNLTRPLGFVDFDGVWVDDRRRCRWALCDASFVIEPGSTIALAGGPDEGAPDAVFDVLTGRQLPVRGRASIDGVDVRDLDRVAHLRALSTEYSLDTGERRLRVAGRTTMITNPTATSLASADVVIWFDNGSVASISPPRELLGTPDPDVPAMGVAGAA